MSTGEVMAVKVGLVRRGPKVRADRLDLDHVWTLRQSLDALPPVTVRPVDGHYVLVDGHHRLEAHRLEERTEVRAVVVDLDDDEAYEAAVAANVTHGKPLSIRDRKAAAAELLRRRPEWSDRRVGEATGLTNKTVAALRPDRPTEEIPQLDGKRAGADGKRRPATKAAEAEQRDKLRDFYREHPDASLSEGAAAVGGVSKMTAAKARVEALDEARQEGEKPALSVAPTPEPTEPDVPRVGDFVTFWPGDGQWAKDDRFMDSTASHELALFMDRRLWRSSDPDTAALIGGVPADLRPNVAAAARTTAEQWTALADALEQPARPSAVEAR